MKKCFLDSYLIATSAMYSTHSQAKKRTVEVIPTVSVLSLFSMIEKIKFQVICKKAFQVNL